MCDNYIISETKIDYHYDTKQKIARTQLLLSLPVLACSILSMQAYAVDDDFTQHANQMRQNSQQAIIDKQQSIIEQSVIKKGIEQTPKSDKQQNQNITPETAIFLAINQNNWRLLAELITELEQETNQYAIDLTMLQFAKASLARGQNNIRSAISQYQQILEEQPDFLRARLDLARLYYKDNQLTESQQQFEILKKLDRLPSSVHNNISGYLTAINNRGSLNTTLSVGMGYETNINQSSETSTCLLTLPNGKCGYERDTPDAINSTVINLETSLNKNWQLQRHHNINANLLAYASKYGKNDADEYNSTTTDFSIGYTYQDHNTNINLSPTYEYRREHDTGLYQATGAKMGIQQNITNSKFTEWLPNAFHKPMNLGLNIGYKDYDYVTEYDSNDNQELSLSSTMSINSNENSQWFARLATRNSNNEIETNSYTNNSASVGYNHLWQTGLISSFTLQQDWKEYDAYNAMLEQRRKDKKTNLTVNVRAPQWRFKNFEPSVNYRYQRNKSNVDWLYDYDESEVSFKLSKLF